MLLVVLTILLGLLALPYLFLKKRWGKLKKLGFPVILEPKFPFGSVTPIVTKSESQYDVMYKVAQDTNWAPVVGVYMLHNPIVVIQDPDLAKAVLVKDFGSFHDRMNPDFLSAWGRTKQKADEIMLYQMTSSPGELWRNLRTTFTPIFTSGKMKAMTVFINETGRRLVKAMDKIAEKGDTFEAKNVMGKFSMDTIASCAFGLDAKVHDSDKSLFAENASALFSQTFTDMLKFFLVMTPFGPYLMRALRMSIMPRKETLFFYDVVLKTLQMRKETNTRRNDLIDMMLDAVKGDLEQDNEDDDQYDKDAKFQHKVSKKLDEFSIVATALVIMVAGYDTTGSTLAFTCHELAKYPEIQDKVREEVTDILDGKDGDIAYEDLQKMTYMDQVLSEVLRYHTPIANMQRNASEDYKLPDGLTIPKNTEVWINAIAFHKNPKYYKNPHSFDPEHFSSEAKAERHP